MKRKLTTTISKDKLEHIIDNAVHKDVDLGAPFSHADALFDWRYLLTDGIVTVTLEIDA